ncbi:MAG: TusE/DsrC/DsvC family sulfur relay protein [Bacteroidetes bacterium]|nr:TusE/DsrC/DsvC family sulfur relay protein [Bacteroidota bacterium]
MATKQICGVNVDVNDEGYFNNPDQWTKEMALEIAKEYNLTLSDNHFKIIEFLRERFKKGEALSIRSVGKSGIVDIKGFYDLFPGGPLKISSKIAGIPKPSSCV